jgi:hypothetical protein
MNTTKKSLATATIAATALAGLGVLNAPTASAEAAATKTFSKTFQQTCQQVGPLTDQELQATVSGVQPVGVKRGAAFKLTNVKIKVVVPANINSVLATTGVRSATVTFSVVNLKNTNLAPATKDAIATNVTTKRIQVVAGQTSSFVVPKVGGLTVGLKGGTKVGPGTMRSGNVAATFQGYDANGNKLGPANVVRCAAENVVLGTVRVS